MRNVWIRGDFKMDAIGSPSNSSLASLSNADFDGVDVYNAGSLSFTSYVDDFPSQNGNTNSGTISNSSHHTQGTVGSFPTPSGFTNVSGNTQVAWDGSTVPDYSTVGAIR